MTAGGQLLARRQDPGLLFLTSFWAFRKIRWEEEGDITRNIKVGLGNDHFF